MIQDIKPEKLENQYKRKSPNKFSPVFVFFGQEFAGNIDQAGRLVLPKAEEFKDELNEKNFIYLFSVGEDEYFLYAGENFVNVKDNYAMHMFRAFRDFGERRDAFAVATAYHLYLWYDNNKFCGRCGKPTKHSHSERALICPKCNNVIYPKIAPAVIVGLINGNKILMTKYKGRAYTRYALIAGFTEIGETAEETVSREVMEEVGLKVKNIRYYKSQPWGTDSNLLLGFFADLDGSDEISLDENELSVGEWISREDMDVKDDGLSLTREMMRVFKEGKMI